MRTRRYVVAFMIAALASTASLSATIIWSNEPGTCTVSPSDPAAMEAAETCQETITGQGEVPECIVNILYPEGIPPECLS